MDETEMKYIFVTGGVISGLGKGIIVSSLSLLLKDLGFKVAPVKADMYLNLDAGTLRPQEHGETFVLSDGMETDQDMGNYERFLGEDLPRGNYITTGQIYAEVLRKEREFAYNGATVEAIPHVTDEIIRRILLAGLPRRLAGLPRRLASRRSGQAGEGMKADIVLVELGGTITLQEIQNRVFVEAARIMTLKNPGEVIHIHVTYLPFVKSIGELKSKPAQTSVYILNSMGIQPDFVFARSEIPLDQKRADKIALFCNVAPEDLILSPDVDNIYKVPLLLQEQNAAEKICRKLGLKPRKVNLLLPAWEKMLTRLLHPQKEVTVAVAAKYIKSGDYDLTDSYLSVVEALRHAGAHLGVKVNLRWLDSEALEKEENAAGFFRGVSGLIVPQGWGSRGVEGKIAAVRFARENKIPYLGLCFGMQMAVIEFARNICHLPLANSTEVDPKTKYPVIHLLPEQAKYLAKRQFGGTIRLGRWPAVVNKNYNLYNFYNRYRNYCESFFDGETVLERHRHRYEFNNEYRRVLEKHGLKIAAVSPDGKLVEAIELANHPFFVGTQYHPELQSRPLTPHPLFLGFLDAVARTRI